MGLITNIKSTLLCIKYPFLYPRNRFTGLHYNNWKLIEYIKRKREASSFFVNVCFTDSDDSELSTTLLGMTCVKLGNYLLLYYKEKQIKTLNTNDFINNEMDVIDFGFKLNNGTLHLIIKCKEGTEFKQRLDFIEVISSKWARIQYSVAKYWHDHVLQWVHFMTRYTEWDAMPKGWRDAFGKQYLEELGAQLKKEGNLKSFRIMQIKEKYGTLRVYVGSASKEVYKIIDKYEALSYHTCIDCGKPADFISGGWICPYCKDHIKDRFIMSRKNENGVWEDIDYKDDDDFEEEK